jgi:hypothetical protein
VSEPPASPGASRLATPSWLDTRLVLGVLLVLVSVVVGARVLSAADRSTLVWAASKDLSAGSQLSAGDLEPVRVRLFDGLEARYVPADQSPTGLLLERGLEGGELLPRQGLLSPQEEVDLRLVTVPVEGSRFPLGLAADQQVDVWLTPASAVERAEQASRPTGSGSANGAADPAAPAGPAAPVTPGGAAAPGAPTRPTAPGDPTAPDGPPGAGGPTAGDLQLTGAQPVLLKVLVDAVQDTAGGFGGSSPTVPVTLSVRPEDVEPLVSALSLGRIDLVRVPKSAERTSVELDAAAG